MDINAPPTRLYTGLTNGWRIDNFDAGCQRAAPKQVRRVCALSGRLRHTGLVVLQRIPPKKQEGALNMAFVLALGRNHRILHQQHKYFGPAGEAPHRPHRHSPSEPLSDNGGHKQKSDDWHRWKLGCKTGPPPRHEFWAGRIRYHPKQTPSPNHGFIVSPHAAGKLPCNTDIWLSVSGRRFNR